MTFMQSIEAAEKTVASAVAGEFSTLEGDLEKVLSKGAAAIATTIKTQLPKATADIISFLEQSALAAVTAAEVVPGDGTVKMAAALASLTVSLTTKGVTLAETEMRTVLESTLLAYKASAATTTTTATTSPAPANAVAAQ